jgi:N-terminal acetyltransferase B complex non-catalytic subunit
VLYTDQYFEGLKSGAELPATDLQPADDLAILAGNVFVTLWKLTSDENYLCNAVVFLEFALTRSKQSFQIRLMLIRIYRLLGKVVFVSPFTTLSFPNKSYFVGAPSLALEHYRAMQIKQVQHDTLSHFILSRASTFSLAAMGDLTLVTECLESSQIYLSNSHEVKFRFAHGSSQVLTNFSQTGDFIVRAFTSEKYSQV